MHTHKGKEKHKYKNIFLQNQQQACDLNNLSMTN